MPPCCDGHQTHNKRLLTSLRESIVDKPPYISGTLRLPDSFFSLFYKVTKDGHAARHINLVNTTSDELEQLTRACKVFDDAYCKAGKMDSECFSSSLDPFRTDLINIIRDYLLEGEESTKNMVTETYKLNIYGKGSPFKPHVNTPRSNKMFGSLVIVFPTRYEGGAMFLRHRGREWIFDSGQALASEALDRQSIGYVAFLNDTEQGVAPVTSGHCVTLTYNLYFGDGGGGGHVSGKDAVSELLILPKPPNQDGFLEAFKALLENPEFMAEGGTLAFGLRHRYPVEYNLKSICDVLKGSDTVVYQSMRALGFEPVLHMYYDEGFSHHKGMIIDKVIGFYVFLDFDEDQSIPKFIQEEVSILDDPMIPEPIEWVTPLTTYTRNEGIYATLHNMRMHHIYGDFCMIVRIGKVGDRLAYPTIAQIKMAYRQSGYGR